MSSAVITDVVKCRESAKVDALRRVRFRGFVTLLCALAVLIPAGRILGQTDPDHDEQYEEETVTDDDRLYWSFIPLEPVEVPRRNDKWCRNEIDAFVVEKLNEKGLAPQDAAGRGTLIRRLSFDLLGLPPTPDAVQAFRNDPRPDAYERLVESMLASPRYGERWAQHWLDLARFAETDGFEHDKTRPDAWRYRDWVIDALNADLPYDRFVALQIAGDELEPEDQWALQATRFCLSGPDMPDINLLDERRHTVLNELTSTVGSVFLGMQIGCAQCHDHKYDPISQADFYRLRAVFEPSLRLKKNVSLGTLSERSSEFSKTSHVMIRGDFRRPGPEVEPGVPRVAAPSGYSLSISPGKNSSGRRTALARWLGDPSNPLVARVMVNRIWQQHFGVGLVDTPSEYGVMGSLPTHERLLDWLASELIASDWSLKNLHRKMVMSSTYRQRSRMDSDATTQQRLLWKDSLEKDPDARLLSRFRRQRLSGEAIRDAMLVATQRLNSKSGGPGVRPPLPKEMVATLLKNQWNVTKNTADHDRRSIYLFARRNLRYPIFEAFDRPSANTSCACRNESTTAPQSLHLLNSEFTLAMSRDLAKQLTDDLAETDARIDHAFHRILGRLPSDRECGAVKVHRRDADGETEFEWLTHLCLALFNCNEFITVD